MSMTDQLDQLKLSLESQTKEKRQQLIWNFESLGRTLTKLSERLKKDHTKVVVNSCGEIQGQGSVIDRLCAEYCLLLKLQEELEEC